MLALRGAPAARRGPANHRCLRGAGVGHPRTITAERCGRGRGTARRGRSDADRTARRSRPRPTYAAGGGEGISHQSAQQRHRLVAAGPRRTAHHRRRVSRPADPSGRESPRHEPAAGRRAEHPQPSGRAGRGASPARWTTSANCADESRSTCRTTCLRSRPIRACSSACSRTCWPTPCATRPPDTHRS